MKASALHQLLGNRTDVKQFHSCKKKTNSQRSAHSVENSRDNAFPGAVPRGQQLVVMLKEKSDYYMNVLQFKVVGRRREGG